MKENLLKVIVILIVSVFMNINVSKPSVAEVNHAENAYKAGMQAYQSEEYQKAVYAFQNSIKFDEKFYKSHYMLGLALLLNEEPMAAEKVLLNAVDTFPKEWKAQALLGEYYSSQEEYDLAIDYYQQVLESKKLAKADKAIYQEKLESIQAERAELWRVSEEEKDIIIKKINLTSELRGWKPVIIEKYGSSLHLSYLSKNEELDGGKWKIMLDLTCKRQETGSFSDAYQQLADAYRKKKSDLTSVEQLPDARIFEAKLNQKPVQYILGRFFKTGDRVCNIQIIQNKSKFKEEDTQKWINQIKLIDVAKYN